MGAGCSIIQNAGGLPSSDMTFVVPKKKKAWMLPKQCDIALENFVTEGTLPRNASFEMVTFRACLEDPIGIVYLKEYAKASVHAHLLNLWSSAYQLLALNPNSAKFSYKSVLDILTGLNSDVLELLPGVQGVSSEINLLLALETSCKAYLSKYQHVLELVKVDILLVSLDILFKGLYVPFMDSEVFARLRWNLRDTYNNVKVCDFDYFGKIGDGSTGIVLKVKKKSTNKMYAMKIQRKKIKLKYVLNAPNRVLDELVIMKTCNHHCILDVAYAFQTPSLVFLAVELALCDLRSLLIDLPSHCLDHAHVRFYTAELIGALNYIHRMGYIYRDLKPGNVLLFANGHVKLADMGGMIDLLADAPKTVKNEHILDCLVDCTIARQNERTDLDESTLLAKRATSLVGTVGYLSPEMVQSGVSKEDRAGYSVNVDWFSLACTMYKLYTFKRYDGSLCFDDSFNEQTQDFLTTMLNPDPDQRLGSQGVDAIRKHAYFQGIDWCALEHGRGVPPPIPAVTTESIMGNYDSTRASFAARGLETIPASSSFSSASTLERGSSRSMALGYSDKTDGRNSQRRNVMSSRKDLSESIACDINTALQRYGYGNWLREQVCPKNNAAFSEWTFVNPKLIREELFAENRSKSISEASTVGNTLTTFNNSLKSVF